MKTGVIRMKPNEFYNIVPDYDQNLAQPCPNCEEGELGFYGAQPVREYYDWEAHRFLNLTSHDERLEYTLFECWLFCPNCGHSEYVTPTTRFYGRDYIPASGVKTPEEREQQQWRKKMQRLEKHGQMKLFKDES